MRLEELLITLIEDQKMVLNNIAKLVRSHNKKPKTDAKKQASKQIIKMLKPKKL